MHNDLIRVEFHIQVKSFAQVGEYFKSFTCEVLLQYVHTQQVIKISQEGGKSLS